MTRQNNDRRKNSPDEVVARAAAALREVARVPGAVDARRDGLTGLFDDRALHNALTEAIRAEEREGGHIGLLFIDLDRFKNVNDRHGHVTGSRILSHVAGLVDAAARRAGGFAARYGGDEVRRRPAGRRPRRVPPSCRASPGHPGGHATRAAASGPAVVRWSA